MLSRLKWRDRDGERKTSVSHRCFFVFNIGYCHRLASPPLCRSNCLPPKVTNRTYHGYRGAFREHCMWERWDHQVRTSIERLALFRQVSITTTLLVHPAIFAPMNVYRWRNQLRRLIVAALVFRSIWQWLIRLFIPFSNCFIYTSQLITLSTFALCIAVSRAGFISTFVVFF